MCQAARLNSDIARRVSRLLSHSFVIVSSRFSSTRATAVQAANSVGVEPAGTFAGVAVSAGETEHLRGVQPAGRQAIFLLRKTA